MNDIVRVNEFECTEELVEGLFYFLFVDAFRVLLEIFQ